MPLWNDVLDYLKSLLSRNTPAVDDIQRHAEGVTGLDVLYDLTGQPVFKAAADILRPSTVDVGMSSAPLAVGKLGAEGTKLLADLLKQAERSARMRVASPKFIDKFTEQLKELLARSFEPEVSAPAKEFLLNRIGWRPVKRIDSSTGVTISPLEALQGFIQALENVPEGALRGLKHIELAAQQPLGRPRLLGNYDPSEQVLQIYPRASATGQVPNTLTHELVHHVASRAAETEPDLAKRFEAYDRILEYLQNVAKWDLTQSGYKDVFGSPIAPHTYGGLTAANYSAGWPMPPEPSSTWENLVEPWGKYFLHHPIEDLAEAGSYSMLQQIPEYRRVYQPQIEALESNPRAKVARLLSELGALD